MNGHFLRPKSRVCGGVLLLCFCCASFAGPGPARVNVIKVPQGGIQPQAAVDDKGVVHLLYFKGDPAGGDLFYIQRGSGKITFSEPLRVNSQPGSAVAIGTIRGGQIAVGKGGRIHVAWNGSRKAKLTNAAGGQPMLYARLN